MLDAILFGSVLALFLCSFLNSTFFFRCIIHRCDDGDSGIVVSCLPCWCMHDSMHGSHLFMLYTFKLMPECHICKMSGFSASIVFGMFIKCLYCTFYSLYLCNCIGHKYICGIQNVFCSPYNSSLVCKVKGYVPLFCLCYCRLPEVYNQFRFPRTFWCGL